MPGGMYSARREGTVKHKRTSILYLSVTPILFKDDQPFSRLISLVITVCLCLRDVREILTICRVLLVLEFKTATELGINTDVPITSELAQAEHLSELAVANEWKLSVFM